MSDIIVKPRTFASYYGFKDGKIDYFKCIFDNDWYLNAEDYKVFGPFEKENGELIYTAKKWFLVMACGTSQIKVTDVSMANKIEAILPSNDKKKRGLKAGMLMYQDIMVAKFLNNTSMLSKAETILKFICEKNGVTLAEIEAYYKNGIRFLISEAVDEEFNKVNFLMENPIGDYDTVLTFNPQDGQYILSYIKLYDISTQTKELSDTSLKALSSEMFRRPSEFSHNNVNKLRAQAALIPSAALSDTVLNEIKTILTNFYITPNMTTYTAVKEINIFYRDATPRDKLSKDLLKNIQKAYLKALAELNPELEEKVKLELPQSNLTTLTIEQQHRLREMRK